MHHQSQPYIDSVISARRETATRDARARQLRRTLQSAADGDEAAWAGIVRRFSRRVDGVARRHRLGSHEAEDVVQTTWLHLVEHIDRIDEPAKVGAWLETAARRESLKTLKRTRAVEPLADPPEERETLAGPDEVAIDVERRDALTAAVNRLPQHHQQLATMLLDESEPSYAEIAASLGIAIGSIGPIRGRIIERLRRDQQLRRTLADDR
jgi:RNA polymerase sigma factor (sigma-70 family)